MLLRTSIPVLAFLAAGITAGAQELRVEVVKHADGQPIPGTLLTLLHEQDSTQPGRFSDLNGRATFNVPRRGRYRIRAEKVGYDTWTSVSLVPSNALTRVRAGMKPRSLRLPPVTGKSETVCSNLTEQATATGDIWGEIRKALAANKVTESQRMVALNIETYDRLLGPAGNVISERGARHSANSLQAYKVSYAGLTEQPVFRVPDASTLLSEEFVASHCFSSIRGSGPENGLLGLEFRPAKLGTKADVSGVLWLDPTTYSLRHLVFDYVNVPPRVRAARATGRIEFQPLVGGQWIVSRWHLKTPRAGNTPNAIAGYNESGGIVRPIGTAAVAAGPVAAPASTGETRITGTVFDQTTGKPLSGVQVVSTSGRYKTATNRGGGFELAMDGGLVDTLIFDHPRLRLLRVPRVRPVSVASGARAQVTVVIPGFAVLRQGLCPTGGSTAQPPGAAIGYVLDAAGEPIANAQVSATWQVLWTEEKGRLMAIKQQRTVETQTAADGSYLLCGFTRDAPIAMTVSVDGTRRAEESLTLPRTMVLERDFRIRQQ
ncbi:MAG: carboxypeptidase regulatory-like domain-containing protein [Gemmatimonadaceae bacterium]